MKQYLLSLVIILLITITGIISPAYGSISTVHISAIIPESPANTMAYRIIPGLNDMAYLLIDNFVGIHPNVTSEAEGPQAAKMALILYRGLPQGTILTYNKT